MKFIGKWWWVLLVFLSGKAGGYGKYNRGNMITRENFKGYKGSFG